MNVVCRFALLWIVLAAVSVPTAIAFTQEPAAPTRAQTTPAAASTDAKPAAVKPTTVKKPSSLMFSRAERRKPGFDLR